MDDELKSTLNFKSIHKKLLDTILEPISVIDKNYTYLYVNKAYSKIFRLNTEDIMNKKVDFVFGEKVFQESIKPNIDRFLYELIDDIEIIYDKKIGNQVMDVYYFKLFDNYGNPFAVLSFAKDITIEVNLKKDWSKIVNSIDDPILIINENFEIRNFNKKTGSLLKLSNEEILNKKCYELFHQTTEPIPECPLIKCKNLSKVVKQEVYEQFFGKYFNIKTTPIFDEVKRAVKYIETFHDITNIKLALLVVEQKEEKYRALVENQGEGVAITNIEEKFVFVNS